MNFEYCEGKVHVVKEGDSLYKISKMYDMSLALIMRANPYVDVYDLKVGSEICIPVIMEKPEKQKRPITMPSLVPDLPTMQESIVSYVIKEGDTLEGILEQFDIDVKDLLKFNTSNKIWLKPGATLIIPEVSDEE
ncbi:MAG: LysM peptidoglycan-binding domain-containing protein [Velocimicrobium sp.]